MKTTTLKLFNKTLATYGIRPRVKLNRYGFSKGSTFLGLHVGKTSHYLSVPMMVKRKFGGQQDIVTTD